VPSGPYVVLPIWGPQTLSGTAAIPVDYYSDLRIYIGDMGTKDKLNVVRVIDVRASLLSADSLLDSSQDPYITLRESFMQNREFRIYDGDPPVADGLYEFFDEEEFAEPE
ncbi:MAG: VacJ family lipoprotein, partial [Gammaproteobacteria bacterium]|nr:VacJ family lipoprotein [Gammaproteobacteria bacterium]